MGVVFIKHKVKDYAKSRPLFDRHAGAQEAAGLTNPRVQTGARSSGCLIPAI